MTSDETLKRLLELSREDRLRFAALPPEEKRVEALRHLLAAGIVDPNGKLTPPYQDDP